MIDELVKQQRYLEFYAAIRYFYRIGEPVIDDKAYDEFDRGVKSLFEGQDSEEAKLWQEYFNRTYDDDPIPYELLQEFDIDPVIIVPEFNSDDYDALNEDKSMSIESVVSAEEAYPYFKWLKEQKLDFVCSIKEDGVNTKMLYKNGNFAMSLSRGRHGNSFDYTKNSAKVVPAKVNFNEEQVRVYGESYVESRALGLLRERYNRDKYKTSKSAAISLLRVEHDFEFYKYVHTKTFFAEGIADTLADTLQKLQDLGFETVSYLTFSWQSIPDDFENFEKWLTSRVMNRLWELKGEDPSDGVVVEVNDLHFNATVKEQYTNRQLALKFAQWDFPYYSGIVKNIHVEQKRVYQSVVVEIEPITTHDSCIARRINTFNPSILINNGIRPGTKVYFEKNSGAVNIMLHDGKLKTILEEGECSDEGND